MQNRCFCSTFFSSVIIELRFTPKLDTPFYLSVPQSSFPLWATVAKSFSSETTTT